MKQPGKLQEPHKPREKPRSLFVCFVSFALQSFLRTFIENIELQYLTQKKLFKMPKCGSVGTLSSERNTLLFDFDKRLLNLHSFGLSFKGGSTQMCAEHATPWQKLPLSIQSLLISWYIAIIKSPLITVAGQVENCYITNPGFDALGFVLKVISHTLSSYQGL